MPKNKRNKYRKKSRGLSLSRALFGVTFFIVIIISIWHFYGKHQEEMSHQLYRHGKELQETGFKKAAEEKFIEALDRNPGLIGAQIELGNIAAASENFKLALPHYKKALSQDKYELRCPNRFSRIARRC